MSLHQHLEHDAADGRSSLSGCWSLDAPLLQKCVALAQLKAEARPLGACHTCHVLIQALASLPPGFTGAQQARDNGDTGFSNEALTARSPCSSVVR